MKRPSFPRVVGPDDLKNWACCPLCYLTVKKKDVRSHWRQKHAMISSKKLKTASKMKTRIIKILGDEFYRRRTTLGLSELEVAQSVMLPIACVENIERASGDPSVDEITKLAAALGLHVDIGVEETVKLIEFPDFGDEDPYAGHSIVEEGPREDPPIPGSVEASDSQLAQEPPSPAAE